MIYEHADLRINQETEDEFLMDFAAVRHLPLEAKGCLSVELLVSVDTPAAYLLRVGWERIEDHTDTFPGTFQANELARVLMAHCAAPPNVIHYNGQEVSVTP
jgi:heme-degrading monooxygenase HmoA